MKGRLFILTILGLTGCASGRLHDTTHTFSQTVARFSRPNHIYVAPIDVSQGTWKAEGPDLVSLQTKVKNDLETDLVKELVEIAPTSIGTGNDASSWQINVTLVHVDPGSATMRELVGLGAGQSKINVTFSVSQGGGTTISGQVNADTGAEMGLHSAVIEGNGMDAERIAREIRNYLVNSIEKNK